MLLDTDNETLHTTARKIKVLYAPELMHCRESGGMLSPLLWIPLRIVARYWRATSQEVESVMNMIKTAVEEANGTISQPALDAIVGIRKYIAENITNQAAQLRHC